MHRHDPTRGGGLDPLAFPAVATWAVTRLTEHRLKGLKQLFDEGCDLTMFAHEVHNNLEWDWKRAPTSPEMHNVADTSSLSAPARPHLFFSSRPWETKEEYVAVRKAWTRYRKRKRKCLTGGAEQ